MRQSFSFKGITRSVDHLYAKDGECLEMVNLRMHDGSVVPMTSPQVLAQLPFKYIAIYRHEIASAYLCVSSTDRSIHVYNDSFEPMGKTSPTLLSVECVGIMRVEFMGNLVCMFTSDATLFAIYDNGTYRWLGEGPSVPIMRISPESQVQKVITKNKYLIQYSEENQDIYWKNVEKGYIDECIALLNKRGLYIDRALFRYALRLFDGSYIYVSSIYYVEDGGSVQGLGRDSDNFISSPNDTSSTSSTTYTVYVQGFKPVFSFENLDLAAWKNIVTGIDVFTSGSIMGHKISDSSTASNGHEEDVYVTRVHGDVYVKKNAEELRNHVFSTAIFYKIAEYDIQGRSLDSVNDVSATNLALCDTLNDDSVTLVKRTARYSYVFNGRLHIANLCEKLFKGYSDYGYVPAGCSVKYVRGVVYTEINTAQGVAILKNDFGNNFPIGYDGFDYCLSPYIMYPDARAEKVTFVLSVEGEIYKRSFTLQPHGLLNVAHFLNDNTLSLYVNMMGVSGSNARVKVISPNLIKRFFSYEEGKYNIVYSDNGYWMYGDTVFKIDGYENKNGYYGLFSLSTAPSVGDVLLVSIMMLPSSTAVKNICPLFLDEQWERPEEMPDIKETDTVELRENVLKVSETDNPFTFPAKQTYTPSHNAILALCSNTVALSQGQFGQHPLYVFCSDGIWAMSVDASGGLAYAGCYPLSREVCLNADSVRGVDSGVVFLSRKGLLLLNGGKITDLSAALDASSYTARTVDKNDIMYRVASIADLQHVFRGDVFVEYASKAVVGFFYDRRELIVSNASYTYSYVLSLENGTWTKLSHSFHSVANCYPDFMAVSYKDNGTVVCTMRDGNAADCNILLITRPLLWGTKQFKRVVQMVLHANVIPASAKGSFNGLACYLLCSNDGEHFKLIGGSERRKAFNDMSVLCVPTQSYRYFALALVGRISSESRITALEFVAGTAWNSRLN